jgi:hypothetical protein
MMMPVEAWLLLLMVLLVEAVVPVEDKDAS